MRRKQRNSGFSLIEVNLAILIAAGGLISLFSLFPVGLRQSVMSQADLHQAAFASSFFEVIAANVRLIDDIDTWNNINDFWQAAVEDTEKRYRLLRLTELKADGSDAIGELIVGNLNELPRELRFFLRETDREAAAVFGASLKLPPQLLIRVRPIPQVPAANRRLPPRYAVSLISTHEPAPAIFSHNTVYSMEFYFQRRP